MVCYFFLFRLSCTHIIPNYSIFCIFLTDAANSFEIQKKELAQQRLRLYFVHITGFNGKHLYSSFTQQLFILLQFRSALKVRSSDAWCFFLKNTVFHSINKFWHFFMKTKTQKHICDMNIRCASDVIFYDTIRLVVQFLLQ